MINAQPTATDKLAIADGVKEEVLLKTSPLQLAVEHHRDIKKRVDRTNLLFAKEPVRTVVDALNDLKSV